MTSQVDRLDPCAQTLNHLLARAHIGDWDLLLVGDGSGTGWEDACGWASVLIDRHTSSRKTFYGGMNFGSVNLAEMMPYYQALCWYHHSHGMRMLKRKCPLRTHIITDSQVTALHGNRAAGAYEPLPKVGHRALWAAFREFGALGYQMEFHWVGRSEVDLNVLGDLIAGLSRREMLAVNVCESDDPVAIKAARAIGNLQFCDPLTGERINPYTINPEE